MNIEAGMKPSGKNRVGAWGIGTIIVVLIFLDGLALLLWLSIYKGLAGEGSEVINDIMLQRGDRRAV
jgi:hypothetical protein